MIRAIFLMIIIGIDPGIARCGWGVIQKEHSTISTIDYGCINTSAKDDDAQRLYKLYKEITAIIKKYKPDLMAVEKLFFASNSKTAIMVGQARGAILVSAGLAEIPVESYTPLEVKLAITGYGKASKDQIQQMVMKSLKLKTVPQPDDTADALAVAITYCFMKRY